MFETRDLEERAVLVGVDTDNGVDVERSLEELKELAKTAGALTVGKMIQARDEFNARTYIGKGKVEELLSYINETDANVVICDDELSPVQLRNLRDELGVKVVDRTVLILDIFAAHATTSEGKIQVELAQLKYRASRLTGMGTTLSRLGGGIGTRGPGEKKLEVDRRLIRDRISMLKHELDEVKQQRIVTRKKRARTNVPVVAIIGYTNAGKSTLLNTLTGASVLEEDMLFATLDPTTRELVLESGQRLLFTDTVGFIHKLPHHLIEAFQSTLEEAKYADILLHVIDASNEDYSMHIEVVYETLKKLGVSDKPIVTVFNKMDKADASSIYKDIHAQSVICASAKNNEGLDKLLETLEQIASERYVELERLFSYQEAGKIQIIRREGILQKEEYREDGIYVKASIPAHVKGMVE